jgi:hypothetical protein
MARDASKWGKPDPSLEDTVNGILKFMHRKGIISVAPREVDEASLGNPILECPEALPDALSVTAS